MYEKNVCAPVLTTGKIPPKRHAAHENPSPPPIPTWPAFDRFPGVRLILGHLGETLPYLLSRFDTMARTYGMKLKKRPSEYIREHMFVTTSGMFSAEPLACAMGAIGAGRVMFSVDYPYESADEAANFIENVPLGEQERRDVCYGTAERLLGLGIR